MSHPLIVEACEELFVPLLVFNNREGTDAELLEKFSEPAWNNPVIRYLNAEAEDVIERQDGIWTTAGTAARMVEALSAAGRDAPKFLRSLATTTDRVQSATFAMHCYWEGEAKLGLLPGVLQTRSAWADGLEVVEVQYDSAVIAYDKLLAEALRMECASTIFTHNYRQLAAARSSGAEVRAIDKASDRRDAQKSDQLYYLSNSPYRFLPLTQHQAMRINGWLGTGGDPQVELSPRQQQLLNRIEEQLAGELEWGSDLERPAEDAQLAAYAQLLEKRLDECQ